MTPRALAGVCQGARAVALAALLPAQGPAIVVVPTARDGEDLLAGLALLAPERRAAMLPAEAAEAYLGRRPGLGSTAAAAVALGGLAHGEIDVLIVPARVLPFPLPPPATLATSRLQLAIGKPVDPVELTGRLGESGYRRVEVVEEAGDYAFRGQVIDIGTPERFIRVLLEFDAIESLAELDPASQRSTATLEQAVIPQLRLFSSAPDARMQLAALLEREELRTLAGLVMDDVFPEQWEAFLGWAQPHLHAWELAPTRVVVEPGAVAAEIERVFAALAHARDALAREGSELPRAHPVACRPRGVPHSARGRRPCRRARAGGRHGVASRAHLADRELRLTPASSRRRAP